MYICRIKMAACLEHPYRYRLLMLLTALHLIHLVSCSCISAVEENLNVNLDSGKLCVIITISFKEIKGAVPLRYVGGVLISLSRLLRP